VHGLDLIVTLASSLGAAVLLGYITQRLRLSPLVGYLLAGMVVGPYTPGFVANRGRAEELAEVGVVLLMFGVGLQFHFHELLAVRRVAVPGAIVQSAVATIVAAVAAVLLGWPWAGAWVFGLSLSVASTVVLIRVLADNGALQTAAGHIAVGWLVVEDLLTVLVMVLLPALAGAGGPYAIAWVLGLTLLKVTALVTVTLLIGTRAIPWALDKVAETRSRELFTLAVLTIALGIALGAAAAFGVSVALGAFLAGMVVGRSDHGLRAASDALPLRDAFAVLFFVSVGMLLDPRQLMTSAPLLAVAIGVVMLAKPLSALAIVRAFGYPLRVSLPIAVSLAQVGEFSFMLSTLGRDLGWMTNSGSQVIVAAAILSIVANPLLYRLIPAVDARVARRPSLSRLLNGRLPGDEDIEPDNREDAAETDHAVVVGYGPCGETATRLLRENGVSVTVVELNTETVRRLRQQRIAVVAGDAVRRETLEAAKLSQARGLVISTQVDGVIEAVRTARQLNPRIRILARVGRLTDVAAVREGGADGVFSGEAEVALAFTEEILRRLGATPEQVDRERARVHAELLGVPDDQRS
jgi:CPA2 family monovalent cation:H+ antiporter-2